LSPSRNRVEGGGRAFDRTLFGVATAVQRPEPAKSYCAVVLTLGSSVDRSKDMPLATSSGCSLDGSSFKFVIRTLGP